jgi:hypothetical protein
MHSVSAQFIINSRYSNLQSVLKSVFLINLRKRNYVLDDSSVLTDYIGGACPTHDSLALAALGHYLEHFLQPSKHTCCMDSNRGQQTATLG